jgi:hypothetical protein
MTGKDLLFVAKQLSNFTPRPVQNVRQIGARATVFNQSFKYCRGAHDLPAFIRAAISKRESHQPSFLGRGNAALLARSQYETRSNAKVATSPANPLSGRLLADCYTLSTMSVAAS